MFLFVRPLVSSDEPALLAGAIWMLAPHVGGFALTAYALSLSHDAARCSSPHARLAREPSLRNAAILTATLCITCSPAIPRRRSTSSRWRRAISSTNAGAGLGGSGAAPSFSACSSGFLALLLAAFASSRSSRRRGRPRSIEIASRSSPSRGNRSDRCTRFAMRCCRSRSQDTAPIRSRRPARRTRAASPWRWPRSALRAAADGSSSRCSRFGLLAGVRAAIFSDALRMIPLFSIAANEHLLWCCAFAVARSPRSASTPSPDTVWRRQSCRRRGHVEPARRRQDCRVALQRQLVIAFSAVQSSSRYWPRTTFDGCGDTSSAPLCSRLRHRWHPATRASLEQSRSSRFPSSSAPARRRRSARGFRGRRSIRPFHGLELLRADEPFRVVGTAIDPSAEHRGALPARRPARIPGDDAGALRRNRAVLVDRRSRPGRIASSTLDSPFLSLMNVRYRAREARVAVTAGLDATRASRRLRRRREHARICHAHSSPATVHSGATRAEAFHAIEICPDFGARGVGRGGRARYGCERARRRHDAREQDRRSTSAPRWRTTAGS